MQNSKDIWSLISDLILRVNKSKRKLVDSDDEMPQKSSERIAEDSEDDDGPIGYSDTTKSQSAQSLGGAHPRDAGASRKRADAGLKASTDKDKRQQLRQELIDMMDEDGQKDPKGR